MICKCCINCPKQNCNTQKTDIETFTKHLELIQSAITRLSGHSFSMKQWCLTIVTIIVSVLTLTKENSLNDEIKLVIFIGVVALTLCFWYLDSFYLLSERKLRKLYEDSIKKNKNNEEIDLFSMDTKKIKESEYYSIIGVMFSRTELPLYLIILILELLLAGVYFMNNNIIKIVVFILSCVVAVGIMIYLGFVIFTKQPRNILSADNKYFYLNGQKLENVYIISNSDAKISEGTKNVIVMDNVTFELKMIDDNAIKNLDKIYFLSTKPTIDSVLYEKIKDKIKYISSQNQCLIINFQKDNSQ